MSKKGYINHYKMKKARLEVLNRFDWNCVLCGDYAWHIHHCDNTNWNHSIDNLISLCQSCHFLFHKNGRPNITGIIAPDWNDPIDVSRYQKEYKKKFRKKERKSQITRIIAPDWNDKLDIKRYYREYYQKFFKQEHPKPRGRPKKIKNI